MVYFIISISLLILVLAYLFYKKQQENRFQEAPQSYLQFNRQSLIQAIDQNLQGLDLPAIRAKKDLIIEKSVEELQASLAKGDLSYLDLTAFYLDRIKHLDQKKHGLNAYITINPQAIEQARKLDANAESPQDKSLLYGIPVAIKDNIFTQDLTSTVGMSILKDFLPREDAAIVQALRADQAIILGKVNLSELANFVDPHMPSGYSSIGGQTLNPYGPLKLSPLGSSSGSATSVTMNMAAVAIGTETAGSIVAPAAIQSLVGYKPSHHLVSGQGIFPLVAAMDTAGPITRSLMDAVHTFNSMAKKRTLDPDFIKKGSLHGRRIGLVESQHPMLADLKQALEDAGATVIQLTLNMEGIQLMEVVAQEFKNDLADFAGKTGLPFANLGQLLAYNAKDKRRRARYGQYFLQEANKTAGDGQLLKAQQILAQKRLTDLSLEHQLDAFASFNYEDIVLAALAGYPELTLPFGKHEENCPQGATFFSLANHDQDLLAMGYAFEQTYPKRFLAKQEA